MLPSPHLDPEASKVGPDVVRIEDGALTIYSRRDMPDWVVREFKRPAIWFKGHKFRMRAKVHAERPFRWKYTLWPWPEDDRTTPASLIEYNEDYVLEREKERMGGAAAECVHWALMPFYLVLGLLWSGPKDWLVDFGFNSRSITMASVLLQFSLGIPLAISLGAITGWVPHYFILVAVLLVDAVFRGDAVLRDHPRQPGFLEWCFRRSGPSVR